MKTFWLCLLISLILHVLFFPRFLSSMMSTGETTVQSKTPKRVNIKVVKKKKPPVKKPKPRVPKPVVKKPKPKPKPVVKPKPKPVQPKVKPKPIAQKPKPKPAKPKPSYPKARPTYPKAKPSYPRAKPSVPKAKPSVPQARPSQSQKRLTRKTNKPAQGKTVAVQTSDMPGGQTGLDPTQEWSQTPTEPSPVASTSEGTGTEAGPDPGPVSSVPEPPAPVAPPPPPKPKPAPPPPKPKPKTTPKPKPVAKERKAVISVPTIDPPAKFRRERLKGKLWVRFKIEANGSYTVSLFESSGNPEFDDFVLNEVRRTAQVEPAIGKDGKPRRSRPRRPVNINID